MHKVLERQLQRLGVAPMVPPTVAQWSELLTRISQTYAQHDQDRYLLERSLDISSAEMRGLNEELRAASATALAEERDRLRAALKAADAANEAKSRFLAVMSHEIRTPINGVTGMLELLGRTDLNQTQRSYLGTARSSVEALLFQVNEILDFSRIEAGHMSLDCIDFPLADSITEWVRNFAPVASDKNIDLIVEAPLAAYRLVRGDPGRLRQIIFNLLSNAIKFTAAGHVRVTIAEPREAPDGLLEVHMDIEDSGIGIPAEGLRKLFQPFSQVDASTTRQFGGTGLGLVVSQRLAAMMGGTVRVRSSSGVGSVFGVSILVAASGPGTALMGPRTLPRDAVVLGGNGPVGQSLVRSLRNIGMDVRPAATPAEALAELAAPRRADQPERALVWDWDPAIGSEACKALLDAARGNHVSAICVLANAGQLTDSVICQLQSQVDSLLMKPVGLRELAEALDGRPCVAATDPGSAPAAAASPASGRAPRILIAEDNDVNRLILIESLRHLGHECDVAVNGREALAAATAVAYELILMDCQMPEMDGYDATKAIRSAEAREGAGGRSPVPIVALTANAMQGDRERCLQAGMTDYAVKPLSLDKLQQLVEHYVAGSSAAASRLPACDAPAGRTLP